jgi:serine/threonine protein kinase/outer membrane protein assembly factor BamB
MDKTRAASQPSTSDRDTPAGGSVIGAESDTPRHGHRARQPTQTDADLPFERLGPYRVTGRVGSGGMGDVYRGHDDSLDRDVAIKVLPPKLARDGDYVRRFKAEATAVAKISHVNVVPVYFIGEQEGCHFFAMRLIDGEPLSARLDREGRLPSDEAVEMIEQCLAGLQAAHARELIHRDVKPGNILLERRTGRPVLVDFGLVRRFDQKTQMTATGMVMGTVDYMAPEQARGKNVDCRTDIYSLGVLFYQILSGRLPFEAETPTATIFQHAYEQPQPLSRWVPDVPDPIVRITSRMMAKDPDRRYATCQDVLADLAAFREGRELAAVVGSDRSRSRKNSGPKSCDSGYGEGRKADDFGYEEGQPTEEAPSADDEVLPADLDELADDSPLRRLRDFAATMFRRHAPEIVQRLQGTTMQVDGAVAQQERRRRGLAKLLEEARNLAQDLARQLDANRQAAAAVADEAGSADGEQQDDRSDARAECEANVETLQHQLREQQQQVDELEHQLVKTDATLAQLESQRDVLLARLKSAKARQKMETDGPRHRLLTRPAVFVIVAALAIVGLLVFALVYPRLRPNGLPSGAPLTSPGDIGTGLGATVGGRVFSDLNGDRVRGPDETGLAGWTVELASQGRRLGTLSSPTPTTPGRYGYSVAVVGDNLLIGDPDDGTDGENSGIAYLVNPASGEVLLTLRNPSPEKGDWFGWCTAAVGNDLLITSIRDNTGATNAGTVYLFDGQTGELKYAFLNPSPKGDDNFGRPLTASDEFIVIGSPKDDAPAYNCGAVYVYDAKTYERLHMFADPTRDAYAWHGNSVGIAGDKIVVGASLDDTDTGDAGMAYVYDASTGELVHRIHSPQPVSKGVFGDRLATVGDKFAIRRVNVNPAGNKGLVDVFDVESGQLLYTLEDPKPDGGPKFGNALAAAGNNLLVGANSGNVAYLFDADTGVLLNTFEGKPETFFGFSVAGGNGTVMIGAPDELIGGVDAGAVHLFEAHPRATTLRSGSDGSYRFDGLPPGKYRLRTIPPASGGQVDSAKYEQTIEIHEGKKHTADLPVTEL